MEKPREVERDYSGDIIRRCADCKWCKSLEGSDKDDKENAKIYLLLAILMAAYSTMI